MPACVVVLLPVEEECRQGSRSRDRDCQSGEKEEASATASVPALLAAFGPELGRWSGQVSWADRQPRPRIEVAKA